MAPILRLDLPGPVAVLGDIHGRSDLLRRLLAELGDMPVLSVGDVVDRGPDSKGCVELLIERGAVGVMGNHEEWVRSWLGGRGFDDFALSRAMGGAATLDSYGVPERSARAIEGAAGRVPPSHRAWFASLAETIDLGVGGRRYWVTHAAPEDTDVEGEDEARELFETAGQRLRWSAFRPSRVADCGRPVVCGHMCQDEPVITRRCIAIDTGCATTPGGALSAVILPTLRVLTVR